MSSYGNKLFGLRDVKVTNIAGTTQKDLPVSRTSGCVCGSRAAS